MSSSSHPYAFLAFYFAVAAAFPLLLLSVTWIWTKIFQPKKPNKIKYSTYECGLPSDGENQIQFKAHYYLYAILFLIFDVEVLFLLPFAVAINSTVSAGALFAMLVFILLLAEGLVWAWHRGHLEWK